MTCSGSANEIQELGSRVLIVLECSQHRTGYSHRVLLLDTAHDHTQVLGLDNDANASGADLRIDGLSDLHRQPFLNLESAGVHIDQPGNLTQAHDLVPGQIRDVAPGIQIEVVASNALSDLTRREADIALRHVPATQPDLIAKRVRESTAHLYAASAYLDLHGRPAEAADLRDAVFIGFGRSERLMSGLNALGVPVTGRNFKLTSESGLVAWELVRQGFGIGVMVKEVASLTPGIERVLPELAPIPVPLWLTTHRELHTSRRIRLVFDLLEEALT